MSENDEKYRYSVNSFSGETDSVICARAQSLQKAIEGRHLVLEAVLIRNVTLPETIQLAINDKLQAEQSALKMKFILDQAQAEAQKRLIEQKAESDRAMIAAQTRADTDKIDAQGHADAKRIDAQATSDYERLVQQHLTEMMLRWQEIEAMRTLGASPNSKIIFLGSGRTTLPMLDLK